MNTKLFYFCDLFCNDFLFWKTEFRNTIYKYSTEFMKCFKYSYIIAKLSHITGKCRDGRTVELFRDGVWVL